jgi:uncharacterized protein (DUF488 family)
MNRDWFQKGIDQLIKLLYEYNIAIMCSEEDPSECHRHHLIAKYLMMKYPEIDTKHIRGDGNIIGGNSITRSLVEETAEQISMFDDKSDK